MVKRSDFRGTLRGKVIDLYTLINRNGVKAYITNYGARLVELWVPDRLGNLDNVVVGYTSMEELLNGEEKYFGAVVGRCANRITNGEFQLNGKQYQLERNEEKHHLHGGPEGFHQVVWGANQTNDHSINLSYRSVDGEGNYPGNLGISVNYTLTNNDELHITFQAESDADTILNMTHHGYYNLQGTRRGPSVYDHYLMINADHYTPVNEFLIPTGEIESVEDTPFDFRMLKPIGRDREEKHPQLSFGSGYDHNFVLNREGDKLSHAARVEDRRSGRALDLFTTEPGLQFYECQYPVEGIASALCLEPQHFPDSPNKPGFPPIRLEAFTPYRWSTMLSFELLST